MKFTLCAEHLIWNLIVFWVFFGSYRLIGFDKRNFSFFNNRQDAEDADLMTTLYFAAMTHTNTGSRDVAPTSPVSRALVALHVILTHAFGTALVFDLVSGPGAAANTANAIVSNSKNAVNVVS
jgi:hypothetical protein